MTSRNEALVAIDHLLEGRAGHLAEDACLTVRSYLYGVALEDPGMLALVTKVAQVYLGRFVTEYACRVGCAHPTNVTPIEIDQLGLVYAHLILGRAVYRWIDMYRAMHKAYNERMMVWRSEPQGGCAESVWPIGPWSGQDIRIDVSPYLSTTRESLDQDLDRTIRGLERSGMWFLIGSVEWCDLCGSATDEARSVMFDERMERWCIHCWYVAFEGVTSRHPVTRVVPITPTVDRF